MSKKWSALALIVLLSLQLITILNYNLANALPNTVSNSISTEDNPSGVDVDETSGRVYVANNGTKILTVIDGHQAFFSPSLNSTLQKISLGRIATDVVVDTTNNRIFVANFHNDTVTVINAITFALVDTDGNSGNGITPITVGDGPAGIAIDKDLQGVYVTNRNSDTVSVINTTTLALVDTDGNSGNGITPITVGDQPIGIEVDDNDTTPTKTDDKIFVANFGADTVSFLTQSLGVYSVGSPTTVGDGPTSIDVDSFSSHAFVTNRNTNTISFIDTDTNALFDIDLVTDGVQSTKSLSGNPFGVGFASDPFSGKDLLIVSHSPDKVIIFDITTITSITEIATLPVGSAPKAVGIDEPFALAHVAVSGIDSLAVIDILQPITSGGTISAFLSDLFLPPVPAGQPTSSTTLTVQNSASGPGSKKITVEVFGITSDIGVRFPTNSTDDPDAKFSFDLANQNANPLPTSSNIPISFTTSATAAPGSRYISIQAGTTNEIFYFPITISIAPNAAGCGISGCAASFFANTTAAFLGNPVQISTFGFTPNSSVSVTLGGTAVSLSPSIPSTDGAGLATFTMTVPALATGTYTLKVQTGTTFSEQPFTIVGAGQKFNVLLTPTFLPPMAPGDTLTLDTVTVTVDVYPIQTLSTNPTVEVSGLPFGVEARFGLGSFSNNPSTVITGIQTGGSGTTEITLRALSTATPGPFTGTVTVTSGTETHSQMFFGVVQQENTFFQLYNTSFSGSFNPFAVGTLQLIPSSGKAGDQITLFASGFPQSTLVLDTWFGGPLNTITYPSGSQFSSSGTFQSTIQVPTGLPSGTYWVDICNTNFFCTGTDFFVFGADDVFFVEATPDFVTPVSQGGGNSTQITVTAEAFAGKDAGAVTLQVFGLPSGVTGAFGEGTTLSSTPQTTLQVGFGGSISTTLVFNVGQNAFPGPVFASIFATSTATSQQFSAPIDFGVLPNGAFFDFSFTNQFLSPGAGFFAFSPTSLNLDPNYGQAGNQTSITASGFDAGATIQSFFFGPNQINLPSSTFSSSGTFSTNLLVPNDLPSGTYFVTICQAGGLGYCASADFNVLGADDAYAVTASPDFLNPINQGGGDSDKVTINVKALSGKDAGTTTLTVFGLPPGVTGKFGSGSFVATPTTTLDVGVGGSNSTTLVFKADSTAFPGPVFADLEIESDTVDQSFFIPIDFGVSPNADFFSFDLTAGFFDFFQAQTLSLSPNFGSPGNTTTLSATGFPSGEPVLDTFFGPTQITYPGGTTFSSGVLSTDITIPNLSSGNYYVDICTTAFVCAGTTFFVLGENDDYTISASPDFLNPINQGGGNSDTVNVSIDALNGKDAGTTTLTVFGLPPGVTGKFGSGSFVATPTTTLDVGVGGSNSTTLVFKADSTAFPGPVFAGIDVVSDTSSQTFFLPINLSVLPNVGFFNPTFLAGLNTGFLYNAYNYGELSFEPNFGASGNKTTITATGFTSNADIDQILFGGFEVELPISVDLFNAQGKFSTEITIPNLSAGFYPVSICETGANAKCAFTDFFVTANTQTMIMNISPNPIPSASQGQTLAQSDQNEITIKALQNQNPGTVEINLFGLPPGVDSYLDTGSGFVQTDTATITVGTGKTQTVSLKFAIDQFASPGFIPIYIEASRVGQSEFVGESVSFSITPSGSFASQFGVGSVMLSPNAGSKNDTITITTFGFIAGDAVDISFGGASQKDVGVPAGTVFGAGGVFSLAVKVPDIPVGLYPLTVSDDSGRTATEFFFVTGTTETFTMNVSPSYYSSIIQGQKSNNATISIKALPGKDPSDITVSLLGLPSDVSTRFDGQTASTKTLSVSTGLAASTLLELTPSSSTPPGSYAMTVQASNVGNTETKFFDVFFNILPAGDASNDFGNLILSETVGRAGQDTFSVIANGFTPSATVNLSFGTSTINSGSQTFDAEGDFSAEVKVPSNTQPGFYPVTITDGSRSDTEFFNVISSTEKMTLDVSPEYLSPTLQGDTTDEITATVSSAPGQDAPLTTVKVQGLPPGASLLFDGIPETSKTLNPGVGQSLSTKIKIVTQETTVPQSYSLIVIAENSDGIASASVEFTVQPKISATEGFASLTINPTTIKPGDVISLAGTGFVAGTTLDTITMQLSGGSAINVPLSATVTVDSNGEWTGLRKTSTDRIPGIYTVVATSGTGANERTAQSILQVVPSSDSFFDVFVSPNFANVTRADPTGINSTMVIQSSNGFSSQLNLVASGLPVGMKITMINSTSNAILGSFLGLPNGTKVSGDLTVSPKLGGLVTAIAKINATSVTDTGAYQIFLGAQQVGSDDVRGRSIMVDVLSVASEPSLLVSPNSASSGSIIAFTGYSFGSTERINLTFDQLATGTSGFVVVPTKVNTTASGTFSGQFTVPTLAAGVYMVNASGVTSGKIATTQLQITPDESGFIMQVSPGNIIIPKGSTGNQTVTVKPLGSFTSDISLEVSGLPTGLTATFLPGSTIDTISGIPNPATLKLTASNIVAEGTHLLDVLGKVSGTTFATEKVSVTIVSNQAQGDFFTGVGPDELVLTKGGAGETASVEVVFVGTPGPAEITLTGLPAGVTASAALTINPDSVTKTGTGTFTFSADNTASVGLTAFILSASITGVETQILPMTVTVVVQAPLTADTPEFDPSSANDDTPVNIDLDFPGTFNASVSIESMTVGTSGTTTIDAELINLNATDFDDTLPEGVLDFGSDILDIEPTDNFTSVEYQLAMDIPDSLSSGFDPVIMFFNTTSDAWEQLSTSTNSDGMAVATVDHFSKFAVGGIRALALGGAVFKIPPTMSGKVFDEGEYPLTIDDQGFKLEGYSNTIQTKTLETGKPVNLKMLLFDVSGPSSIQHVALYLNLHGMFREVANSDTYIIYEKGKPVEIHDPQGFFSIVDVKTEEVNKKLQLSINLIFAKSMEKSDIIVRSWNNYRASLDTKIVNAIAVTGEEITAQQKTEQTQLPPVETPQPYTEHEEEITVPSWIKNNAGWWNENKISDSEFVEGIRYLITEQTIKIPETAKAEEAAERIPAWIKTNAGWWSDGLISDKEFVTTLQWLISKGIINIQQ